MLVVLVVLSLAILRAEDHAVCGGLRQHAGGHPCTEGLRDSRRLVSACVSTVSRHSVLSAVPGLRRTIVLRLSCRIPVRCPARVPAVVPDAQSSRGVHMHCSFVIRIGLSGGLRGAVIRSALVSLQRLGSRPWENGADLVRPDTHRCHSDHVCAHRCAPRHSVQLWRCVRIRTSDASRAMGGSHLVAPIPPGSIPSVRSIRSFRVLVSYQQVRYPLSTMACSIC